MMRTGKSNAINSRRPGQALVEFSIVVTLLMLLLLGVVEFGRAWQLHQTLTDAAREGARTMVVGNGVTADSVRNVVRNSLIRAGFVASDPPMTITLQGFGDDAGTPGTVGVDYIYTPRFIAGMMGWTGTDWTVRTSVTMRNE
jgi:Flp pilus assembly protein TadG